MVATASPALRVLRTQAGTVLTRLVRRLARSAGLTETPRDTVLIGLDIAGYGRRTPEEQLHLRRRLFAAVRVIRGGVGGLLPYDVLDRGDGVLMLLPGATDTLRVLTEALPRLARQVDAGNRRATDPTMLLRCVVHRGHAQRDRWGWAGDDVNLAFRLLDSSMLKLHRSSHPGALTAALSDAFHEAACHHLAAAANPLPPPARRFSSPIPPAPGRQPSAIPPPAPAREPSGSLPSAPAREPSAIPPPALTQQPSAIPPPAPAHDFFSASPPASGHDARAEDQDLRNLVKETWHDKLTAHTFREKEIEQTAWIAALDGT